MRDNIFRCILLLSALFLTACGQRSQPSDSPYISKLPPAQPQPLKKQEIIMIDPGHGGKDLGTSNKKNGYEEKKLTLATALLVSNHLNKLGYRTLLTRRDDAFVSLGGRAEIANNKEADLFVSIHYNHSSSEEAHGIEVYYYKENKTPSSKRILLSKDLGQEVLKEVIVQTGAKSRGVKQANFAVIRETDMPAILIEAGFLSNGGERTKIKDPKYMQSLALGIAKGIDSYLEAKKVRPRRDLNARPAA